jgi:hypothetical protein
LLVHELDFKDEIALRGHDQNRDPFRPSLFNEPLEYYDNRNCLGIPLDCWLLGDGAIAEKTPMMRCDHQSITPPYAETAPDKANGILT